MNDAILIISRHAPYDGDKARAALDTVFAFAAFEKPVNLLLIGAGVSQLTSSQDSQHYGRKNHAKMLASLPLYGIDKVYVDANYAERFNLHSETSALPFVSVSGASLNEVINSHRHIVSL